MRLLNLKQHKLYLMPLLICIHSAIFTVCASQATIEKGFNVTGRVDIDNCDSIELQFHTYYLPLSVNSFERVVVPVIDGRFEYVRNESVNGSRPFNLGIHFYVDGRATGLLKGKNLFLALPGDNIKLIAKDGIAKFSGRGAHKYNVRWAIERITSKSPFRGTLAQVAGGPDGARKIAVIEAHYDSLYAEKINYINNHRHGLTDEEYHILKYDALGTRRYMFLRTTSIVTVSLGSKDSLLKDHYLKRFKLIYQDFTPDTTDADLKAYAQNFALYNFTAIHLLKAFQRGKGRYFHFGNEQTVYDYIKTNYGGLLRDKMLAMCVQRYSAMDNDNILLAMACADIKDSFLNELVCTRLSHMKAGAKPPMFELTDSTGVLREFIPEKGKVTLIDFWYTGCGACALIAKELHGFLDSMRMVDDFELVSVSIDKNQDTWKRSINNGKYTHPSAMNYYTNGEGSRHAMTKHFDVKAYPRFILVNREGKIASSDVYPALEIISKIVTEEINKE